MSFRDFVERLTPVYPQERDEWEEILSDELVGEALRDPVLFWYLSSGFDTQALAYFSEHDTSLRYHTPTVDAFIYSDYSSRTFNRIRQHYDALDPDEVVVYKDDGPRPRTVDEALLRLLQGEYGREPEGTRSWVAIDQMVPLRLFSDDERSKLAEQYAGNTHGQPMFLPIRDDGWDFVYISVVFESSYFGEEYFPILWSSVENWLLLKEVWIPHDVHFTYLCGVCDGCRKGGAYRCVNVDYADFLPVLGSPGYWIADHSIPQGQHVASFGWGHYGGNKSDMVQLRQ
jgi:hypothetical protein